ncbi:hypothetical protein LshimejAT787_2600020 [Lyophyllum shimeji]|uniref:F-box domain-containing protein n=1 Tax=Lyophyllum shimeji TaxID=47721 RepID=A0A9P3URY9_LYOSH|nr:hypothetical protein LshimejAT787_2600020 [Lyophyllum shimeji]
MSTFTCHIPLEVVGEILKLVQGADLARCSYVSRAFAQIVEPLLYHNITVKISRSSAYASSALFASLASSTTRCSRVKTLIVKVVTSRRPFDFEVPRLSFPNIHTFGLMTDTLDDTHWFHEKPTAIAFCEDLLRQPTLRKWAVSGPNGLPARLLFLPQHLIQLTLDATCFVSQGRILTSSQDGCRFRACR